MQHNDQQAIEVRWYCEHGKYPKQRIVLDSLGRPYVIGDRHWNRDGRPREYIEACLPDVGLKVGQSTDARYDETARQEDE